MEHFSGKLFDEKWTQNQQRLLPAFPQSLLASKKTSISSGHSESVKVIYNSSSLWKKTCSGEGQMTTSRTEASMVVFTI